MSASNYTTQDLVNGEIVPNAGGPNSWLVRFGEGEYELVGRNAKNQLILEDGVFDVDTFTFGGVTVHVNFDSDEYSLERDGNTVPVPVEKQEHVLWSIHDADGERLNNIFDELYVPRVRVGLMDMLMPLLRNDDTNIVKTEDGWVINGEILLSWDSSNHPIDVEETHVVRSGDAVPANTNKQARDISFTLSDSVIVNLPNGTQTELDDVEQKFLVSAAVIADADISQMPRGLQNAVENSRISSFTDTKSGLYHGHSMNKHTLDMLGVTDEAIDRLWYHAYDHAGVHELCVRREEFVDAPIDVFEDSSNDDPDKWEKIEYTSQKAPIPKRVRRDLEDRYE